MLKVVNFAIVDWLIEVNNLFAVPRRIFGWRLPGGVHACSLSLKELFAIGVHEVALVLERQTGVVRPKYWSPVVAIERVNEVIFL